MQNLVDIRSEGVKIGGVLVQSIHFADDQAMVSHTGTQRGRGLKRIMDALQSTDVREIQHADECEKD